MTIFVNGRPIAAAAGQSVAAALLAAGVLRTRDSPSAQAPRGPFCLMGVCQDCAVVIDGVRRTACQTPVRPGQEIVLDRGDAWNG